MMIDKVVEGLPTHPAVVQANHHQSIVTCFLEMPGITGVLELQRQICIGSSSDKKILEDARIVCLDAILPGRGLN